jgi:hypothetical protein
VPSAPENPTVIGWLYQPFESGGRAGIAAIDGAVASNLRAKDAWETLPALSVQLPATAVFALSGPAYVDDVQLAIFDVPSVPENPTATGWLYQPFASGGRDADGVTAGGVLSSLIVLVMVIVVD